MKRKTILITCVFFFGFIGIVYADGAAWFKKAMASKFSEEQIDYYTKAINSGDFGNKNLSTVYNNRGNAYKTMGAYDEALADFDKAISLNRKNVQAYSSRAGLFKDNEEYVKAIADYNKVLELDPGHMRAGYFRALTAFYLEEYNDAREYFKGQIKILKKNGHEYTPFDNLLLHICNAKTGKEDNKILVDVDDHLEDSSFYKPIIGLFLGNKTIDEVLAETNIDGRETEVYFFVGQYYLMKENKNQAKIYFKKSIDKGKTDHSFYPASENEFKKLNVD